MSDSIAPRNLPKAISSIPMEQLLQLDYFKHRGDHFISRAFIHDKTGIRERAFSDTIKAFHESSSATTMATIVGNDPTALQAAFTVFQWLATNIGQNTLNEAIELANEAIMRELEGVG